MILHKTHVMSKGRDERTSMGKTPNEKFTIRPNFFYRFRLFLISFFFFFFLFLSPSFFLHLLVSFHLHFSSDVLLFPLLVSFLFLSHSFLFFCLYISLSLSLTLSSFPNKFSTSFLFCFLFLLSQVLKMSAAYLDWQKKFHRSLDFD